MWGNERTSKGDIRWTRYQIQTAASEALGRCGQPLGVPSDHPPPSGHKINVRVDRKVILNVTSDTDDEIHAHIGGPGYELPVQAGKPAQGSFTLDSAGTRWSRTVLRRSS